MSGTLVHLSDVHFGTENAAAVAAATALSHEIAPDLVVVSGDLTQSGRSREFQAAADWLKTLPEPLFVTVGNHDVPYWDPLARLFWPWRRFETTIGHPAHDHQFQAPGLMVRGVTTARGAQLRGNWSKGVIDLDQTRTAAEALRAAPEGALRIIACHHPLIEMLGTPMTGEVRRGREAALILTEAGVDLILTGHVHVPFALAVDVGDRCSYAVGCGTLSTRERGMAPGFNRIDWTDETVTVTALGFDGQAFEPIRTWNLERRRRPGG